jgi:hypothetical protein
MLVPLCVLVALGLAAGLAAMTSRFAAALEGAAARFQDQAGYAALVLPGTPATRQATLFPPAPADVSAASVITALCSVAGAIALALLALYWRRLPVPRRILEPGTALTAATRRFQSGVINDYITWLTVGVAAIGGILAVIIR